MVTYEFSGRCNTKLSVVVIRRNDGELFDYVQI